MKTTIYFSTEFDSKEIISRIGKAQIIINNYLTPVNREVVDACPDLKLIQTWSTGLDHIDLEYAKSKNNPIK